MTLSVPLARTMTPAAVVALLTLAACSTPSTGPQPATETSAGPPPAPTFGHVHALVHDEGGDQLFAATHSGVWSLPDPADPADPGTAVRRIGNGTQDTMGMTITDDGTLYASGHPGPGEDPGLPHPNLGLIRSIDHAATWEPVSLYGEVDFHALTTTSVDGAVRIAGLDSGTSTILISDDAGTTWETGAATSVRDLLFLVNAPDRLLATTQEGLQLSTDAGRSFAIVPDAPRLLLVDAMPDGDTVGIDADGTVWTVRQDLTGWQRHGGLVDGAAQALTYVAGPGALVVATEHAVVTSTDLGRSWTPLVTMS